MKQLGLKFFTDTYLTSAGLMIFFVFFVCMVAWVFHKNRKAYIEHMENLPLGEEK